MKSYYGWNRHVSKNCLHKTKTINKVFDGGCGGCDGVGGDERERHKFYVVDHLQVKAIS